MHPSGKYSGDSISKKMSVCTRVSRSLQAVLWQVCVIDNYDVRF